MSNRIGKNVDEFRKEAAYFAEGKFNQITQPRNPDTNQKSALHLNFADKKKPISTLLLKSELKDLELKFD